MTRPMISRVRRSRTCKPASFGNYDLPAAHGLHRASLSRSREGVAAIICTSARLRRGQLAMPLAALTFAIMALLSGYYGDGPDMLCSAGHDVPLLSGMTPMYLLMSAFHSPPWLKLISRRRRSLARLA